MSKRAADHSAVELIAYNVSEAAAALGINHDTMGRLIRARVIPHVRIGNRKVVGKKALEQWLTEACLANADTPLVNSPPAPLAPLRSRRRSAV